ncbi:MAG: DUF6261 family protein [Tannerellaceae bacterium]|jgi:hypothetical protein|nr:DUF6261 family protein [Tannerellaceae bacterium]
MLTFRKTGHILHAMRNSEHFGFFEYIVTLCDARQDAFVEIKPLWKALRDLFVKENAIFKYQANAAETGFICKAYVDTYHVFMLIKRTVEAATYDTHPPTKAAAGKLKPILRNYRAVTSAAMNESSALVINLVQEMRSPRNAEAVNALGLAPFTDQLETNNEAFRSLYFARAREREALVAQGNMRHLRPQVNRAFSIFTQTLGSLYITAAINRQAAKAGALAEIIEGINAIILQYEHILARRAPGFYTETADEIANIP